MTFTVCILAAGLGTRMKEYCGNLHKALLLVKDRPAIFWVFDAFPKKTKFIIAVGYRAEQLKEHIKKHHSDIDATFVDVGNFDGPGSGPGYSLLCCKNYLQEPFVFATIDDLTPGPVPPPAENWFGVQRVPDTKAFSSPRIDENGFVTAIDDKTNNNNKYAFIGIAGVKDYEAFWERLESNKELKADELQVSNGFEALIEKGMKVRELEWFNTGSPEAYEKTKKSWSK